MRANIRLEYNNNNRPGANANANATRPLGGTRLPPLLLPPNGRRPERRHRRTVRSGPWGVVAGAANNEGNGDGRPPSYNPQNTEQPMVLPSPKLDAKAVVEAHLDALARPDDPWPNHGIQLAYEFGYDIGGLDRSMYFGFPKDLYHLDHFMGQFANQLPELLRATSYRVSMVEEGERSEEDGVMVDAVVESAEGGVTTFRFHLKKKKVGSRKGSLMTYMIERL